MSFSSDIKAELCKIKPSGCCEFAELYGIFLLSRNFCNSDTFFSSDTKEISDKCAALIEAVYGIKPEKKIINGNYALSSSIINVGKIYADYILVDYIDDVFKCENCAAAFARGAFMSGGTATDPQKEFHLEIKTCFEPVAISMQTVFSEINLNAHISKRANYFIVYFKGNGSISDFLAWIGASKNALEVIDVALIREMRNKINRAKNCETANIGKTVDAVIKQTAAINKLKSCGKLSLLSDELQYVAKLRLENPEMSLNELSKICEISRSGLNHRFNRLIEISKQEKEK